MHRKAVIFLLPLFLSLIAHADSVKGVLDQKYKNHVLALRSPFAQGDMKFDSDGHLLSAPAQGPWLTYGGIYVEKLELSSDTLRLEGRRGAVSENKKTGKPVWEALSKSVNIEIHLLQPLASLEGAEAVLGRVFVLGKDSAEHVKPEFRRADDSTSGETIYHVGQEHTNFPKPVFTPEPEFSGKARKAKYQATAVMTIVVDKSGYVTRIKIEKAAGMELDDNAVERVKTWRFEPATRDGQAVAVEMNIEVSFNLYSSHVH
jgi:TonB family protein